MFNRLRFRPRIDRSQGLASGTVVAPFFLAAPFVLLRAQASGARASAIVNDGLAFFNADTPRFSGTLSRLLIEGQSTNVNTNPEAVGTVVGNPGTFPTNWFVGNNGQGLNWNVAGVGVEASIPYVDLRISGTSSGTINASFSPQPFASAASPGQAWTGAMYFRRVAGSLTGLTSVNLDLAEFDSVAAFLRQTSLSVFSNPASLLQSFRSLVVTTGASTAIIDMRINVIPVAGIPVDATFRVGATQLEQLPFATSSVFPAAGATGPSTRGVDLMASSLASLGIPASGACTILWSGVIPTFISGATHTIACVDDASVNNRFTMRVDQATGQLQTMRSLAGANTTAAAGAVTAGVPFKAGMAINGAGRAAVSLNGGAVAAVTGGPSSGLTHSRLGNISNATAPMWGETLRFQVLTAVLSDADLQTATGALP